MTTGSDAFDLARTFAHLGRGSTVTPLPDFEWTAEHVEAYRSRFAGDAPDGRLVCVIAQDATWDGWERHPAGEELSTSFRVASTWCRSSMAEHVVELRPGEAMINPANVWHTARVHEPGLALFITPGKDGAPSAGLTLA